MPIINVSVTGKPDAALSARIAEEVTEITATHLRKDPTLTAVAVTYHDPQHWFAGGKSLAEHGKNTFWLDIKVVDGTNTKLELEAYLKAIFEAFGRLLGRSTRKATPMWMRCPPPPMAMAASRRNSASSAAG